MQDEHGWDSGSSSSMQRNDRGERGDRGGGGRRGGGGGYGRGGGGHREGGGGGRGRGRGLPLAELDPALTEVSRKLIGCAIEVHKNLGPGFEESVYRKALEFELRRHGVSFESDARLPVKYQGEHVGDARADMVIDNRFIVDLMASRGEIGGAERASLRALLRVADMELGLIINFAERRLKDGLVRVLNPDKLNAQRGEGGEGAGAQTGGRAGDEHDEDLHDDGGGLVG